MEVFGWLGSETASCWAALGRGVYFFIFFGGVTRHFRPDHHFFCFPYFYSSIRFMGHGDSVWGSGDILTATAH